MSKKIDYTGKVFGKLTVIKEDLEKEKQRQSEGKPKGSYWLCECSCEKHTIISVERHNLTGKHPVRSCGCLKKEKAFEKRIDLTGCKFGRLTVTKEDLKREESEHNNIRYWFCKCECGNVVPYSINQSNLTTGHTTSCGCQAEDNRSTRENLLGQKFNKLTVLFPDYNRGNRTKPRWFCKCDCGNPLLVSVASDNLKNGSVKSCGCALIDAGKERREHNVYELSDDGNYYTVYDKNGEYFLIDKEDYEKVSEYYWTFSNKGYVFANFSIGHRKARKLFLHRFVMGLDFNDKKIVDHKRHPKTGNLIRDNRKNNLRVVEPYQNSMNSHANSRNTTGVKGVSYTPHGKKRWLANLTVKKKKVLNKLFSSFKEAVQARKEAEQKYQQEYAFDVYNKTDNSE